MTWGWIVAAVLVAIGLALFARWRWRACLHHWHTMATLGTPYWSCCWCPKVRPARYGMPRDRSDQCYRKYARAPGIGEWE